MPRRARLDASDALHHLIVGGVEKRRLVNDDADRRDKEGEARTAYSNYVKKAIGEGRQSELVGGGLIR
jgi:hypothetical protein